MSRTEVALTQRYIPHYRLSLFKRLCQKSKYSWEFICGAHPGAGHSGLDADDLSAIPTRPIRNISLAGGKVVYQHGVIAHLRRNRYRAVVLELSWPIVTNVLVQIQALRRQVAVIGWSKGIRSDGTQRAKWRRPYEQALIRLCGSLLVYGDVSKRYFESLGYPSERIFIARNTVDVDHILRQIPSSVAKAQTLKPGLGLNGRSVIGYLGRLTMEKGVDKIIRSFVHATQRGLEAELVIVGDGPERTRLQELATLLPDSERVHFVGEVPVGEEGAYLQLFDLYVTCQNAGLAVLEAMAHGKPVLSTPQGLPETELIEDNVTGCITRGFAEADLAEGMLRAFSDKHHIEQIGQRAQSRVAAMATHDLMVEAFDAAVDSALGEVK